MTQTIKTDMGLLVAGKTRAEVEGIIASKQARLKDLIDYLPYADGGAYRQDQISISIYRTEIAELERLLAEMPNDPSPI